MKINKLIELVTSSLLIASSSIITYIPSALAEKASFVITHPGQPWVAVFATTGESYALGCPKLAEAINKEVVEVNSSQWNSFLSKFPVVGDIHCNSNTRLYAPEGEPRAIVFRHRNGEYYRHYVSHPLFMEAIGGNPVSISASQFRSEFPNRGVDFHR